MGRVHNSTNSVNPFIIGGKQPLDVRTVLQTSEDLKDRAIMSSAYKGMVVYIVDDDSLYVCHTESNRKLTNIEDGWRKVDVDYSVRIVESESNLTDGTIKFPYQGMMVYVTSESALYILLTKGSDKAKDINNWRKISSTSTSSIDKIGIDVAPEGGTGFKITGNEGVVVDDYVNVENYIKAKYLYTSKGVNSFDKTLSFIYDSLRLSKGGSSYIELYVNGDNWMTINDPDNSLGLSITINGKDYVNGEPIAKETLVCFGADIKLHEGWTISYGEISRPFTDGDYELIDIYRSELSPKVYAYRKDIDVRMLTEDDLVNISNSILIDLDGEGGSEDSDNEDPMPLQNVIVNMNNAITKLEQTKVEPDTIEQSEIDKLFS